MQYKNVPFISILQTYKRQNGLIMTQMPTPETVNEFLRLIIQENCHFVVMMNDEDWEDTVGNIYTVPFTLVSLFRMFTVICHNFEGVKRAAAELYYARG